MWTEDIEPEAAIRELGTESPPEQRREVLRIYCTLVGGDAGVFCKYGHSDGDLRLMNVEAFGDRRTEEALESLRSDEDAEKIFWNPRHPPLEMVGSFEAERVGGTPPASQRSRRLRELLYEPVGIRHEANALLYDNERFLGWLGLYRTSDDPFTRDELDALDALVEPTVELLAKAEHQERSLIGEHPAYLLFEPPEWFLEGATGNAVKWLTDRRRTGLMERLEANGSSGGFPFKAYLDGFRIWLSSLQGDTGERYLATVEQSDSAKLAPDSVLTPRQREVVGYAAAGATNREIAETLGITPDTVSDHLSEAYRRLGVANRVELALKLKASD